MNGCSHEKNIYYYRRLLACKKCGMVFGPQFKIQGNKLNIKGFDTIKLIENKSEFRNSKEFSIKFQIN